MKARKERYIPAGSKPKTVKGADAIVYISSKTNSAIAYKGKSIKKAFYFTFPSKERMDAYLKEFFDKCKKEAKKKADEAAAAKAYVHPLKVGDIVYNSWGWEQTNVDFYQVVAVPSGKTVKLQRINAITTEHSPMAMSGSTVPDIGNFRTDEPVMTKRVQPGHSGADSLYIKFNYGWGSTWDGQPVGCSWYA